MSCQRPSLSGPVYTWTPQRVLSVGVPFPLGELPERGKILTPNRLWGCIPDFSSRLSPEVFSTSGYFRKTAGVWNQIFPSHRWAAKGNRVTPARLPVITLATRSQHVIFAYDQVIRPHRSYRPSGGLPKGKATDPPHVDLPAIVRSQRRGQWGCQGHNL